MLLRILKKDMMNRKVINAILFVFISLSTIFLASSINNIIAVSSAVDYYMDYAKVSDMNIVTNVTEEKDGIYKWLEKQEEEDHLTKFDYEEMLILSNRSIQVEKKSKKILLEDNGDGIYLSTLAGDYNKVFDEKGKAFTLKAGEMAISVSFADNNKLKEKDRIWIKSDGNQKEFVITKIMKDAAFGNDMMGMTRFMVNEKDYASLEHGKNKIGLFNIMSDDSDLMMKKVNNQEFKSVMNVFTSDMYKLAYSFDMILSALLILVGICLILIALLVLRFTLVFTMEEQYQEIGILKAIGLRDFAIKKLYLVKYLLIVTMGSFLGLLASIPISDMMIQSVSHNMLMESANANIFVNIISALFVVVLVLLFCYYCTRKLNKVSAITAIRGGDTGERYHKRRGLSLNSFSSLSVPLYLGCNDMLSHIRRYLVLIITFCISFILITIPLNTLNTMGSDEMSSKFGLDTNSKAFIRSIEKKDEVKYSTVQEFKDGMSRIENEMKEKGYDVKLKGVAICFLALADENNKVNLLTLQPIPEGKNFLTYSDGTAPSLDNEIAISETVLKQQGWEIGDSVKANFNGKKQKFIITGTYSDYMQLGRSARLSSQIANDKEDMMEYWAVMLDMKTSMTQEEVVEMMKAEFPQYGWCTGQELVDQNVGGIQKILKDMMIPMTIMLCVLIMLITLLMEKLFITREKGEIAMLKSIGFKNRTIRYWQTSRMVFVSVSALLISIPLSLLSNQFVLKPIFKIMGADVTIQVNPLETYIIYPAFLLAGIIVATLLATISVKRIHIKEINNVE